jgi:hypothetical protein
MPVRELGVGRRLDGTKGASERWLAAPLASL